MPVRLAYAASQRKVADPETLSLWSWSRSNQPVGSSVGKNPPVIGPVSVGVIERDVEIRGEWSGRTNLLHRLDAGDFYLVNVHGRRDRSPGTVLSSIPGELCL